MAPEDFGGAFFICCLAPCMQTMKMKLAYACAMQMREREVGETARTGRFSFEVRRERARACSKFRAEAGESARMQPLARSIEHAGAGVIASGVERAEN